MTATGFRYGFRVLGGCQQPRRLVDVDKATTAYSQCDQKCELDSESYLSAFRFAGDFRKHIERTGSTAGFGGPCWSRWMNWDIDNDDNLTGALDSARRLTQYIVDELRVADDDVLVFVSGGKGFHIQLPTSLWIPAPGLHFHRIARRFGEAIAEQAGVRIDTGVYDKVRLWRAPNSKHPKGGLHKRRLSVDELMHLQLDAILKMAEHPAPFELPNPNYRSEPAAELWAECAEQVRQATEAKAERRKNSNGEARLNRGTLQYIRDGAAVGDRHRLLFSAAANLAELGAPLGLCSALLIEAAFDSGLPPSDVRRAITNGWVSVNHAGGELAQHNAEGDKA